MTPKLFDTVTDHVSGERGVIFASLQDTGYLAVSIQPSGATRFYCPEHQRIFGLGETCPDCEPQ